MERGEDNMKKVGSHATHARVSAGKGLLTKKEWPVLAAGAMRVNIVLLAGNIST